MSRRDYRNSPQIALFADPVLAVSRDAGQSYFVAYYHLWPRNEVPYTEAGNNLTTDNNTTLNQHVKQPVGIVRDY